jgi:transcriptional regulator with XRE-family HTH domain
MKLRKIFIDNLKKIRKEKKISQMKIAELCETSTSYIGEIEIGKKFPSVEMIEKLANALNIKACELFMEDYSLQSDIDCTENVLEDSDNLFQNSQEKDELSESLSPKERIFAKEIAKELAKELINNNDLKTSLHTL